MTPLATAVIRWQKQHGRHTLPWQQAPSYYKVWLSEIMLQQTQVSTVIPYYLRFLKRFPNIKQLATAELDEVLSYWSGLGYYARARNLHKTAKIINDHHRGRFLKTVDALAQLPGIGRSTAGAIASLAGDLPAVTLDGNVKRVLGRVYAINGWPGKADILKSYWDHAINNTPSTDIRSYNQGMMDLGATLCTRSQPNCSLCPLLQQCQAFKTGTQTQYPSKKPKAARKQQTRFMLILQRDDGAILLTKRPEQGIWGGLWSFPEAPSKSAARQLQQTLCSNTINQKQQLSEVIHKFSHFDLTIKPILLSLQKSTTLCLDLNSYQWILPQQKFNGGMATPISKIIRTLHESTLQKT